MSLIDETQLQSPVDEIGERIEPEDEVVVIEEDGFCKKLITSSSFIGTVASTIFAFTIPTILYFFFVHQYSSDAPTSLHTCSVAAGYRVPCGHFNITKHHCTSIRCCHLERILTADDEEFFIHTKNNDETETIVVSECFHFVPSKYSYSDLDSGNGLYKPDTVYMSLGKDNLKEIKLTVSEESDKTLMIVLHEKEVEVVSAVVEGDKDYSVKVYKDLLAVDVRRGDEELLLTTTLGPVQITEHYWEWTFQLTRDELFGLGELFLAHNATTCRTFYRGRNIHSVHVEPVLLARHNSTGFYHAVRIEHNTGPLEVCVLPSRLTVLRALGGQKIALHMATGPTPREALRQLRNSVVVKEEIENEEEVEQEEGIEKEEIRGGKEEMVYKVPPMWMLSPHICRDGETTLAKAVDEFMDFHSKTSIKYSSDCIHENIFLLLAQDRKLKIENLMPSSNLKLFVSYPPQIPIESTLYDEAITLDILYRNRTTGEILNATYNNVQVAYPDYTSPLISTFMEKVMEIITNAGLNFDGFVMRDNWPAADNVIMEDHPKFIYLTDELLDIMSYTLPWDSHSTTNPATPNHLLTHNSYGVDHLAALSAQLPVDDVSTVFITPTVDSARFPNAWGNIPNVETTWTALRETLKAALYHSVFVHPLLAVPPCGSTGNYDRVKDESICIRWYLTAATMPLLRISSQLPRRDPESLYTKHARNIVLKALDRRHTLLPYFRTILNQGDFEPVIRPMFYNYPNDNETYTNSEGSFGEVQYMLGETLLVSQPVTPNAVMQRVYLPDNEECGGWYEYGGGERFGKGWLELHVVESDWIMFARGGDILPLWKLSPKVGVYGTVEETFNLFIALGVGEACKTTSGTLFFETTSLEFTATGEELTLSNLEAVQVDLKCSTAETTNYRFLDTIYIYGSETFSEVVLDNLDLCTITGDVYTIPFASS